MPSGYEVLGQQNPIAEGLFSLAQQKQQAGKQIEKNENQWLSTSELPNIEKKW